MEGWENMTLTSFHLLNAVRDAPEDVCSRHCACH